MNPQDHHNMKGVKIHFYIGNQLLQVPPLVITVAKILVVRIQPDRILKLLQ